jgi:hypothetical protein
MHTFTYIANQVTPKIFIRFTIRGGALTNSPKAQPFSLPLCTHFISNYFVPTFEDRKNVRDWMDLRSKLSKNGTKKEDETTIFYWKLEKEKAAGESDEELIQAICWVSLISRLFDKNTLQCLKEKNKTKYSATTSTNPNILFLWKSFYICTIISKISRIYIQSN